MFIAKPGETWCEQVRAYEPVPEGYVIVPDPVSAPVDRICVETSPGYGDWEYNGDVFKDDLTRIRQEKENLGILVDNIPLQTDKESVAIMAGYVTEAVIDGLVTIDWKCKDKCFHTYTVQDFKPVFKVVKTYVHDCYTREMELAAALDAAPDPSTVDLTTGWPVQEYTTV